MIKRNILLIMILALLTQCTEETRSKNGELQIPKEIINKPIESDSIIELTADTFLQIDSICAWDTYLLQEGLVNIQDVDSTILVDLKYSSEDNFMERDMYGCLNKCYLQPDVAERLKLCQTYLKEKDSTLSLLIYDGVRPRSVQQYMWDLLDMPINEKAQFVSNPKRGSLHNFGAALDITIANAKTKEPLDMGAKFDQIGILAWPIKEKQMLDSNLLTQKQIDNRKLLRRTMHEGRFFNIQTEWWHFNACNRDSAYARYHIIEGFSDSTRHE